MKNNLLKYYISAIYFGSTFIMFADPGTEDETGTLEDVDTAPIDDYVWVLFAIGLIYVFYKMRVLSQRGNIK